MPDLPTGTVTFLFTDIEGSTRLWEQHPDAMPLALARHDLLLRQVIEAHGGHVFKTVGDQFCGAFAAAPEALAAALAAHQALQAEPWPQTGPLRVRIALHTGTARERDGDYFGAPLSRVTRLLETGHGGQILLSQPTYDLARDHLPEGVTLRDLGEHRLRDLARPERVFQPVTAALPADFAPLNSLDARPHNLPAQPTALIGRDKEVAVVEQLLRQQAVRLVTLTGPGGTGKSRLGLQVAAALLDQFAAGVFFVALAPISDPSLVVSTIAQTLGLRESAGLPLLDSLKAYLHERQLLLLLDNFEQVLAAAPLVAELLAAAAGLKVLITSRAALRLRGEKEFPVPPLALPDPKHLPALEALSQYAAVELFIQRALDVSPEFGVTNENAPAVAEICARLDGLPLAIELAAARMKLFPPEALLNRLSSRLRVLTGGARDLPARQQTLRGAIAWSYDLLGVGEKQLFRRLAVLVGGCNLEAAEAVCNPEGQIDAVDGLASLVDNSLLRQEEASGEPRFSMLETIREYGLERLSESGEGDAIRQQHAEFFLALAEEAEPELWHSVSWLERLERDHDNLRAALDWCAARSPESGLRLAGALHWFWHIRGHFTEGRQRLETALAGCPRAEVSVRRIALCAAAQLAGSMGDTGAARAWGEGSLALCRETGDRVGRAWSLLAMAGGLFQPGGSVRMPGAEEALTLFREMGDRPGTALALYMSALATEDGGAATVRCEESLALSRSMGYRWFSSYPLEGLGWGAQCWGQMERSRALFEESLAIRREYGDRAAMMHTLHGLWGVAHCTGDVARATALVEESLALARESGNKLIACEVLGGAGYHFLAHGDYGRARAHFEEELAITRELGRWEGGLLVTLANVAQTQGDQQKARALLEEARTLHEERLATQRERGEEVAIAWSLTNLGTIALDEGDHDSARAFSEESLAIFRKTGVTQGIPHSLTSLARVARAEGDYGAARLLLEESLAIHRELGQKPAIVKDLEGLAAVAVAQDQHRVPAERVMGTRRAARLFGTAARFREAFLSPLPPAERVEHDRSVAALRDAMGEEAFAAAWAEGRAMSLDEAVEFALSEAEAATQDGA